MLITLIELVVTWVINHEARWIFMPTQWTTQWLLTLNTVNLSG